MLKESVNCRMFLMFIYLSLFLNATIKTLSGQVIGVISFVAIDPDQGKVVGLVLKKKFWQNQVFVIVPNDIFDLGGGVVTIRNLEAIEPLDEIIRAFEVWQKKIDYFGIPAETESGKKLGNVEDMLADKEGFYIHRFYIKNKDRELILTRDLVIGLKNKKLIFKDDALNQPNLLNQTGEPKFKPRPSLA